MRTLAAIYDFELMPYALGDVLTWNVQTAIACEAAGCDRVDIHICLDQRHPASIYQSDTVNADNCWMFFNELFGAFGTHPRLGNLLVSRSRKEALDRMRAAAVAEPANAGALADYEHVLENLHDQDTLIAYFTKYIYFHKGINAFAAANGRIPLLQPSLGCTPDIDGLLTKHFSDKRIVVVHMRMRRLDAGYGGNHTYARDSDFLEWYDFLRTTQEKFPDVHFIMVGRLQEKPLEFLRLPNVTSLRTLGMGLGHELTLMLRSDLFIGTSSGFAALANFSSLPYFITKMSKESCNAYEIPFGTNRLPFATELQKLIYEPETCGLLLRLLDEGLQGVPPRGSKPPLKLDPAIDIRTWEWERAQWLYPGATMARFRIDETYRDKETAFLIAPKLAEAEAALAERRAKRAVDIAQLVEQHFPLLCGRFPEYLELRYAIAGEQGDGRAQQGYQAQLQQLASQEDVAQRVARTGREYLAKSVPLITRARSLWHNRRLIPGKLRQRARRWLSAVLSSK